MYFASRDQVGLFINFGHRTNWDDVCHHPTVDTTTVRHGDQLGQMDGISMPPCLKSVRVKLKQNLKQATREKWRLDNIVSSCVVYSLGSRLDFSFENDVVDVKLRGTYLIAQSVVHQRYHTEYIFIRGVLVVRMRKKQYPRTLDTVVKLGSTIPGKP